MLRKLYDWTIAIAQKKQASWGLFGISFAESSFFPIPPDPLLAAMALARPNKSFFYAAITTVASVLGGLLGYAIGYFGYETIGKSLIEFYGYTDKIRDFEELYANYGFWVVLIAGMTPIPYKLATILSGFVGYSPVLFTIASTLSRSLRFFAIATILYFFGDRLRGTIERHLNIAFTAFIVLLVGGFVVLKILH